MVRLLSMPPSSGDKETPNSAVDRSAELKACFQAGCRVIEWEAYLRSVWNLHQKVAALGRLRTAGLEGPSHLTTTIYYCFVCLRQGFTT